MNVDIIELHKKIIKQIEIIEKNTSNNEAIHTLVDELFPKFLEDIKLAIVTHKECYYGYFFMNLDIKIDVSYVGIAAVLITLKGIQMVVNPLTLGKRSIRQIIFIICHEIEHLILNHLTELTRINPSTNPKIGLELNYAMDASINDRLLEESKKIKILEPPTDMITSEVLSKDFLGSKIQLLPCKDFLYYYNYIKGMITKKIEEGNITIISLFSDYKPFGKDVITEKDIKGKNIIAIQSEEDDPSNIEEAVRDFARKVDDSIPPEDKELLPKYQIEKIEKLKAKPKIKWQSIFRKYIGTLPDGYKKTKMRPNRRQPERYDLQGKISQKTFDIVIAIDTSASLEKSTLENIFTEIFNILKNRKYKLTIIECDDDVRKVYTAKNIHEIDMNVKGRGGTNFTPVIKYINNHREYRNSLLIYFTDGLGNNQIPKPNVYKVLWVLTGKFKKIFSLQEPYGEVIEIEMGKKKQ